MDKKRRLTRLDEWETGEVYSWLKNRESFGRFVLIEKNKKHITLNALCTNRIIKFKFWKKRFRKIE